MGPCAGHGDLSASTLPPNTGYALPLTGTSVTGCKLGEHLKPICPSARINTIGATKVRT
jgi:hypothetical protein